MKKRRSEVTQTGWTARLRKRNGKPRTQPALLKATELFQTGEAKPTRPLWSDRECNLYRMSDPTGLFAHGRME